MRVLAERILVPHRGGEGLLPLAIVCGHSFDHQHTFGDSNDRAHDDLFGRSRVGEKIVHRRARARHRRFGSHERLVRR